VLYMVIVFFYVMKTNFNIVYMDQKKQEKELIIVKRGQHFSTIKTADIAYIYTENDITYIIDGNGKKFIASSNLNKLEQELGRSFFRANRQFIINIHFLESFRSFEKTKLVVKMNVDDAKNTIYISQVTAPKFKEWVFNF